MKHLILMSLVLVSLMACKKKTFVTINAQNYITGEGSAYANMDFNIFEAKQGVFDIKYKNVYQGVLNENGEASFEFKMNKNRSYELNIEQPSNICYGEVFKYRLDVGVNNNVVFDYLPCGYLNIPSKNINCEDSNDLFQMKYYYSDDPDIYNYNGFLLNGDWSSSIFINGCADYSGQVNFYTRPVGSYTVEWKVSRTSSGTTYGSDTFSITENDSTTYLIQY